MNKKALLILAIILGIAFIVLAIIYFITPANALPSFIPGYQVGLIRKHYTHGVASLCLGLVCFAYAWFQSGKKSVSK